MPADPENPIACAIERFLTAQRAFLLALGQLIEAQKHPEDFPNTDIPQRIRIAWGEIWDCNAQVARCLDLSPLDADDLNEKAHNETILEQVESIASLDLEALYALEPDEPQQQS